MIYEIVPKRRPGSDLTDYEIRPEGAGKGTPKTVTVWGHYGTSALETARIIVEALNARKAVSS
jgi:hypothetical protein